MTDEMSPIGSWRRRRRIVHLSLAFDALVVAYCLYRGEDTALFRDAMTAAFYHGGLVIGSYVFGATWDDQNARKAGK